MKVIDAETLRDGSRHFKIEAVPEAPEVPAVPEMRNKKGDIVTPAVAAVAAVAAVTEECVWGADVPLAVAQRETKLLLAAKYGKAAPTKIAAMIDQDL